MRWTLVSVALLALILVPFLLFEEQVTALAVKLTDSGQSRAYVAAAIGALLAFDVFLPIPSSILSVGAGALLGFLPGAAVVWAGMTAGCLLAYGVGSRSAASATRLVGADGLARASALARTYGDYALVLCRPVPVLAEASIIFAGLVRVPWRRFVFLTAIANLGIAVGYAAVGAFSMTVDSTVIAFLGAVTLPGLAALILKWWLGRRSGPSANRDVAG